MSDRTHTVADLAGRFLVSEATVIHWIRSGDLKAVNVGRAAGNKKPRWRITTAALEAFELRRSATPAPMPSRSRRTKRPAEVITFY